MRAPASLAHGGRVRVRGRTVPLPSQLHAPGTGGRSQIVPRVRRHLLLRRRVDRRRLPRRHRGLLRPARVRSHRSAPTGPRSRARARGRLPAAAGPRREADRHRPVRTLGRGSIPRSTRADRGGRCGSPRRDRSASPTCASCAPKRRRAQPPHLRASPSTPTARAMPSSRAHRRRPDGTTLLDAFACDHARERREPAVVDLDASTTRRGGGRGRSERSRCAPVRLSVSSRRRSRATTGPCAPRFATSGVDDWTVLDQRRATVPQGREPRAGAHALLGDAADATRSARDLVARARSEPRLRARAHARRPAGALRRRRRARAARVAGPARCSGATHAAYASQAARQARAMVDLLGSPPERVRCGAAHDAPLAADGTGQPWSRGASLKLAATRAPDVGQGGARPLDRARPRPPRQHPSGRAHSGVLPGIAEPGTDAHL